MQAEVMLNDIEGLVRTTGAAVAALVLAVILWGIWRGLQRPRGRATGRARELSRAPVYLAISIAYFGTCFLLWRPLPVTLSPLGRALALLLGVPPYFTALALILWGRLTLAQMYNVSSSLGAQLYADHRLVTHGPFAYLRHPMYLGILLAGLGGTLIYRTWTLVFFAATFLGLPIRARREEEALAAEFGQEWQQYCRRVPAWIPRLRQPGSASGQDVAQLHAAHNQAGQEAGQ
jgi:hypothetical protein